MTTHRDDAATTLVVGHSNDPAGDYALIVAADLAQQLHARLHIVHVVETGDYSADCDTADWDEQCRQQLSQQCGRVELILSNVEPAWVYEARHGDPAAELAQAAEVDDALLIVVGTRGEGLRVAIPRLIAPSVSHGVIHCQPPPVLVVRGSWLGLSALHRDELRRMDQTLILPTWHDGGRRPGAASTSRWQR